MNGIPLGKNKWFIKQYSPSDFFGTKFGGGPECSEKGVQ